MTQLSATWNSCFLIHEPKNGHSDLTNMQQVPSNSLIATYLNYVTDLFHHLTGSRLTEKYLTSLKINTGKAVICFCYHSAHSLPGQLNQKAYQICSF